MTSAPLPLPRCRGHRLGFGAVMLMSLVIFGMALLPPVSGGAVANLTCYFRKLGEPKRCSTIDEKYCCFRYLKYDRSGCSGYNICTTKDECVRENRTHVQCFCSTDNCNKDESFWKDDPLYKQVYAAPSTARPNGSNMAVIPVLLVVVTVLGSFPHLITALF